MESNNLVAEDVVTGRKCGWNSSNPGVVVGDHGSGSPCLAVDVVTAGIDLNPFQGGLINIITFAVAVCNIGDDGADMAVRPSSPLERDLSASLDGGGAGVSGLRVLMADDIGARVVVRGDEAIVEILGIPSVVGRRGLSILDHVVVLEQVALIVGIVGQEAGNSTVRKGGGSKSANEGSLGKEGRHCRLKCGRVLLNGGMGR